MIISKNAIVDPSAKIGENTRIGHFSIIEDNVIIGKGCEIGSNVLIANGTVIGNNCTIFHGAALGSIPQDLKFGGEKSELLIGDNTVVREFCTLNRGTKTLGYTKVGSNCLLMAYVHVAHDCILGNNVILANSVNLGGHVTIDDFAIVGGIVAVHQFVHIGKHAMIGGGFRAIQDVPPFILAGGYPLKYTGINSLGLRRRGFDKNVRKAIKNAYRLIFLNKLNLTQALQQLDLENSKCEELKEIHNFIKKSKRGLI